MYLLPCFHDYTHLQCSVAQIVRIAMMIRGCLQIMWSAGQDILSACSYIGYMPTFFLLASTNPALSLVPVGGELLHSGKHVQKQRRC